MTTKQLIYNPLTEKNVSIDPYGNTAKKIYKYLIMEENNDAVNILPADLGFNQETGRFRKVKLAQDRSNVRVITYQQVKDVESQESFFYNVFKGYAGKTIKRAVKYVNTETGVQVVSSETVDVPALKNGFHSWWKNNGMGFLLFYPGYVFSFENDGLEPKFQAQLLILTMDKVDANNFQQYFKEGITNCMMKPIMAWAKECEEEAKSKSAKARYKKIIKDIGKYEIEFETGVPEGSISEVCNKLQIGIKIDLPSTVVNDTKYIEITSQKKPLKIFKYINTRINHIELNECKSTSNYVEVDQKTLNMMYQKAKEEKEFIMWKENGTQDVVQINTLSQVYKLGQEDDGYQEIVREFEENNNLGDYKVEYHDNEKLSNFLIQNAHSNQSILFDQEEYDSDEEGETYQALKHIDMKKSYSRGMDCPQYEGYLAKITDFRTTSCIVGIGIYMVRDIKFADNPQAKLIERMKVFHDYQAYPSPELKYFQSIGITFDIVCGCWGSKDDIVFGERMMEKDDKGVSHYCKWYGTTVKHSMKERYNFTCDKLEFAQLNAYKTTSGIRYNEYTGDGLIEYPRNKVYHQYHIGAFITSYARINMYNQLEKFEDKGQIVAVQVDGIYYKGEVTCTDLFVPKTKITINSIETNEYVSNAYNDEEWIKYFTDDIGEPRPHNMAEVHIGGGGCGKTHLNLVDKGLCGILYVAPSWKLSRNKKEEYECQSTVFHYLVSPDPDKWKLIRKNYSTLVIDEISMLNNDDKALILNRFSNMKIIFCGDIGYQLPPVEGKEFVINGLPQYSHNTNYRCKCPKLAKVLKYLRDKIGGDNDYLDTSKSSYFGLSVNDATSIDYSVKDLIITATHKQKDTYTERYKHIEKYVILENTRDHSNGEIVYEKIPKVRSEMRHAFTIHSIQGETATENLFIDMNQMKSMRMFYTAISRAKYLSQIKFIRSTVVLNENMKKFMKA